MTVHPLRSHTADVDDDSDLEFPFDFHEDFADFEDADESMHRYGSLDRQYRYAHRTISATVLAALTGIQVPVCQAFHYSFFGLLESVGDFDGLVATPRLLIPGRQDRIAAASDWLGGHPEPDVAAMMAEAEQDFDESAVELDHRIAETIDRHSLDLAMVARTNPSLTLGSTAALHERVIDEILDLLLSCQVDEIDRLTDTAIDLLCRMPTSIRLLGGAVLHRLGDSTGVDTADVGSMEV